MKKPAPSNSKYSKNVWGGIVPDSLRGEIKTFQVGTGKSWSKKSNNKFGGRGNNIDDLFGDGDEGVWTDRDDDNDEEPVENENSELHVADAEKVEVPEVDAEKVENDDKTEEEKSTTTGSKTRKKKMKKKFSKKRRSYKSR